MTSKCTGMNAMLEHDFLEHLGMLSDLVEDFGVTKIFFSGHSLGGGIAQIATLALMGQIHSEFSTYRTHPGSGDKATREKLLRRFKGKEIEGVFFSAPMALNFP